MSQLVKVLNIPDTVNLYVVGDLHGEYDKLIEKLHEVGFNFETDICIGVGDLVDRGKQSLECVKLLDTDWFYTVRGNHEDFCIKGANDYNTEFYHKMENNGGKWFYELPEEDRKRIARYFGDSLPLLLELNYKGKKYGVVHADCPVQDWELLKEMVEQDDMLGDYPIRQWCIWSRETVRKMQPVHVAQVDKVFLGHTVFPEVVTLGNLVFIDTGAVFADQDKRLHLTVLKVGD